MTNITAVLDNNVLVSALLFPQSVPGKILKLWNQKKFQVVSSEPILEELHDVISRAKFVSRYHISTFLAQRIISGLNQNQIKLLQKSKLPFDIRDPKDIVFLDTAIQSKANYLVTGDQDLLVLANHKSIKPLKIVTPAEFIRLIS